MNIKILDPDSIPKDFFIFVNQLNPVTYHNLKFTKTFSSAAFGMLSSGNEFIEKYIDGSATYNPFQSHEFDCKIISMYTLNAINDYRVEFDAEEYRFNYLNTLPSRFSAIYAFGDYDSCLEVNKKYAWPINQIKKFRLKEHPLNRVAKVNMEIVSLARRAYNLSSIDDPSYIWEGYWKGSENLSIELPGHNFQREAYHSGLIWEYLIEGIVELVE